MLMDEAAVHVLKKGHNSLKPTQKPPQEGFSSITEPRRRKATQKQQARLNQGTPNITTEIANLLPVDDSLTGHTLRAAMEKQIPQPLQELFCVAYFASVPFTHLWNFPFSKRYCYRVYLLCEVGCWPLRYFSLGLTTHTKFVSCIVD